MRYPKPLSDLLQEGLEGLGLGRRLAEFDIWRLWPEVVGPAIASRSQPLRIINGTLTVAVSSGPWMQELSYLRSMMKDKLNERLGSEIVKEIVLKSGRVVNEGDPPGIDNIRRNPLSARQLAMISEQASAIADPETRAAFEELMKASLESETCSAQSINTTQREKK